jgi:hypothetical protein
MVQYRCWVQGIFQVGFMWGILINGFKAGRQARVPQFTLHLRNGHCGRSALSLQDVGLSGSIHVGHVRLFHKKLVTRA